MLSSHQLPEVQQTVDDVVIIAAGRIVARGALRDVLGGDRAPVLARSAHADLLGQALQSAGFSVERGPGDRLLVTGAIPAQVGRVALRAGIALRELTQRQEDLEVRFFQLTSQVTAA